MGKRVDIFVYFFPFIATGFILVLVGMFWWVIRTIRQGNYRFQNDFADVDENSIS
jgi:hypothetical protein